MPKKSRKAGRPRFAKGLAKNGTIRVRVTPDELREMQERAKADKQTLSEWIRGTLSAAIQG